MRLIRVPALFARSGPPNNLPAILTLMNSKLHTELFAFAMWWRIIYGTLRTLLGLGLLNLVGTPLTTLLERVMRHELMDDPGDTLFNTIHHLLQLHPFTITYFLSAYMIFWGVTDVFLSVALLKQKLWAFPTSLALIAVFMIYEIYRFTDTHSLILLGIIGVDIFIFFAIRHEYKQIKWRGFQKRQLIKS